MSRLMSFAVLIGIIVVIGFLFYRVMASFFLPLFAAAVLVVIFHPIYRWVLVKTRRKQLAAALTTGAIVLIVLLPIALVLAFAALEGAAVLHWDQKAVVAKKDELLQRYSLDIPWGRELCDTLIVMTSEMSELDGQDTDPEKEPPIDRLLRHVEQNQLDADLSELRRRVSAANTTLSELAASELETLDEREESLSRVADPTSADKKKLQAVKDRRSKLVSLEEQWKTFHDSVDSIPADADPQVASKSVITDEQYEGVIQARRNFDAFKSAYVGSPLMIWIRDTVNPTDARLRTWIRQGKVLLQKWLLTIGGATPGVAGSAVIGLLVTIVGVFFFFADGNTMVKTAMRLSPLDDQYETELIQEFDQISRAVVVATLLSAVTQGVLAGIGFYFAGIESVFLLTLLTAVLAMIPFIGATAVWLPTALWLYFFEDQTVAAIGLAIYGAAIISQADNVIKPWVLHGQSRLHPLLALLSVLGGVQALGPIGILVGPMIVAFAQALMNILHRELVDLDGRNSGSRRGRSNRRGTVVLPIEGFSTITLSGQSLRR